jgi:dsRNA-specific ribonuclease
LFPTLSKTTADVFESVVGAFVLCNGFDKIFKTLRKLGAHFEVAIDFKRLRDIPLPALESSVIAGFSETKSSRLQDIIAHDFVNKPLVELALVSAI